MRILILGGSGQTGRLVIDEALQRGHTITALIRNERALEPRSGLTLIQGSPTNQADVERAFHATPDDLPTVAICTLGQQRASGNPWARTVSPPLFVTESVQNLIHVMSATAQGKIVAMSANGAGNSLANLAFFMRWIMAHSNMRQTCEDQNSMEAALKNSSVQFVLARAAMLKDTEAAGVKVLNEAGEGQGLLPSISRKSVATFLVDAAERSEWDGMTPVIMN